jgi:hypothetical protein
MDVQRELPKRWTSYQPPAEYTITLLVFAWALLPAGFMVMLLAFDRYPSVRTPLALATYGMLLFALFTGVSQRHLAWREPRMSMAVGSFAFTGGLWMLLTWLELTNWWWVTYGLILGCIPLLYVAMNHLASCTSPGMRRSWPSHAVLNPQALPGWTVVQATWAPSLLAWKSTAKGEVATLFGAINDEQTMLCIEVLTTGNDVPMGLLSEVNWPELQTGQGLESAEE